MHRKKQQNNKQKNQQTKTTTLEKRDNTQFSFFLPFFFIFLFLPFF